MMKDIKASYIEVKTIVENEWNSRPEITNRRGNNVVPRKYHMTEEQQIKLKARWLKSIKDVPSEIIDKLSSDTFFNPYRENGCYYGAVQALFLLGANEWHSYIEVKEMMQKDMSTRYGVNKGRTSWMNFALKGSREGAQATKDLMGRIIQNFRVLQRLGGLHPYGYKLKQLLSCIDILREADGIWYFKLNTKWSNIEDVSPSNISRFNERKKADVMLSINERVEC